MAAYYHWAYMDPSIPLDVRRRALDKLLQNTPDKADNIRMMTKDGHEHVTILAFEFTHAVAGNRAAVKIYFGGQGEQMGVETPLIWDGSTWYVTDTRATEGAAGPFVAWGPQ